MLNTRPGFSRRYRSSLNSVGDSATWVPFFQTSWPSSSSSTSANDSRAPGAAADPDPLRRRTARIRVITSSRLNGLVTCASASGTPDRDRHGGPDGSRDESKSQRPDEQLLTGDTAAKVRAAALAKYPGATIQRVETDSDGVYEAHLTTADGQRVTVEVGKDFAVTGEEQGPR